MWPKFIRIDEKISVILITMKRDRPKVSFPLMSLIDYCNFLRFNCYIEQVLVIIKEIIDMCKVTQRKLEEFVLRTVVCSKQILFQNYRYHDVLCTWDELKLNVINTTDKVEVFNCFQIFGIQVLENLFYYLRLHLNCNRRLGLPSLLLHYWLFTIQLYNINRQYLNHS